MERKRKVEAIEELKKLIKAIENDEPDSVFCVYTRGREILTISFINGSSLAPILGSIEIAKAEILNNVFKNFSGTYVENEKNEKNH